MHSVFRIVIAAILLLAPSGCNRPRGRRFKRQFFHMETVTEITVVADSDHQVDAVWHSMDSLLLSWEQRFSVQRVGSEVYRLNAAAESTVAVSAQLAAMLHAAVSYGDTLTGGFDVSILPLKLLWGLDEGSAKRLEPLPIPSDSALRAVHHPDCTPLNCGYYLSD